MTSKFQADDFITSATERDYLGSGTFASVRICSHPTLGNVAVKCFLITGSKVTETRIKNDVEKEANVLCRLQHQNIIKCFGITQWSKCYGLVMEKGLRYNMEDLLIHDTHKSISWPVRLKFSLDIAKGLEYLHCHNPDRAYIHGDLKPQNILFDKNLVAKVADFGAVSINNVTGATASVKNYSSRQYTALYTAPEFLKKPLGKRTVSMDVYSYAMIVYEIITRCRVFSAKEKVPSCLIEKLIAENGQKPDLELVDQACKLLTSDDHREIFKLLHKVMVECWAYNPNDRRSIKSVKHLLEDITINEPCHIEHLKENHRHNEADDKVSLNKFDHPFKVFVHKPTISSSDAATEIILNPNSEYEQSQISHQSSGSSEKLGLVKSKSRTSINQEDRSETSIESVEENVSGRSTTAFQQDFSTRKPFSITRVRPSIGHMKETKHFESILSKIKNKEKCVLHCHGVPGSGKSEIVRKLAEKFPFSNDSSGSSELVIKWHIQCKDSRHDVKTEFEKLSKALFDNAHINDKDFYQSVVDELSDNFSTKLVNCLASLNIPVLIIVEDPDKTSQNVQLLQDFIRNLSANSNQSKRKPSIHFFITSRRANLKILSYSGTKQMEIYCEENIVGFNNEEGFDYLVDNVKMSEANLKAAKTIVSRFSGLPLGLQAAKGYCNDARITYQEYLDQLKDFEYDVNLEKKGAIEQEYGENAKHVFSAIVLPFVPLEELDTLGHLHLKILMCISYFHHDRIPRFALDYCCQLLRETEVKELRNKIDVGKLITKLFDHGMCRETDEKDITFSDILINAFRQYQHSFLNQSLDPLKKAIEVMSGMVSKDMRKKEHSEQMHKLRPHLQSLLRNIQKEKKNMFGNKDELIWKALTSHLYETTAVIMLNESPAMFWEESEFYYKEALKLIWEDVEDLSSQDQRSVDATAKSIVKKSKEKGMELPENFVLDYASKLNLKIYFEKDEIDFLKHKSISSKCFETASKLIECKKRTKDLLMELQRCGLFLSNENYASIFYAERVATILHSHSRHILYSNRTKVDQDKYMWMTWLSNSIAVECKNACNVSLLIEHLSQTGGLIPIVLKSKKSSIPDSIKAREFCEKMLFEKVEEFDIYENGMLKEVFGPSYNSTHITLLRSITRVNARLLKSDENEVVLKDADQHCRKLLQLSEKHCSKISSSTMCIIYCAKYYAARDNITECIGCFKKFFQIIGKEKVNVRFHVRCWAVYNYARAVCHFELPDYVDTAIKKCSEVLDANEMINKDLKVRLELTKQQLLDSLK